MNLAVALFGQVARSREHAMRNSLPIFDFRTALLLTLHPLPNYSVGSSQNVWRDREVDLLGRLQIDHELELCRLLYGELGRFCAFEDFVDISGRAPIQIAYDRSIGHETAFISYRSRGVNPGQ